MCADMCRKYFVTLKETCRLASAIFCPVVCTEMFSFHFLFRPCLRGLQRQAYNARTGKYVLNVQIVALNGKMMDNTKQTTMRPTGYKKYSCLPNMGNSKKPTKVI
mmetsp:Transcript_46450/g.75616  ORF Transcript_46450/g.75616 Transcript_46450/m.75616 type:complete len:105 (+) Transcript_46450:132-446(+)